MELLELLAPQREWQSMRERGSVRILTSSLGHFHANAKLILPVLTLERDWDRDKYRMGQKVDDGVQDVENFPDNAANWTGRKVGEVEDIPQDIEQGYDRAKYGMENKFDNAVEDVADIPQDIGQGVEGVASWVGRKFGDVERFGEGMENSFDTGEAQGRNDRW